MAKQVLCAFGVDVDAVAGRLGSYQGEDSPFDISHALHEIVESALSESSVPEERSLYLVAGLKAEPQMGAVTPICLVNDLPKLAFEQVVSTMVETGGKSNYT